MPVVCNKTAILPQVELKCRFAGVVVLSRMMPFLIVMDIND
jgi:hypothetical protein